MSASPKTLYFAYGSNLSLSQMALRCPTAKYQSLALLKNHKWLIGPRGYANIVPSPDEVYGMLYTLSASDEAALDIAEGVPNAYVKKMLPVEVFPGDGEGEGRVVEALVYVDVVRTGEGVIRGEVVEALVYVDVVRTGEGVIRGEYVGRMNRAIGDAVRLGMGEGRAGEYVRDVLRKWVREEREGGGVVEGVEGDPFHPSRIV